MTRADRRLVLARLGSSVIGAGGMLGWPWPARSQPVREIEVVARRFRFEPDEIALKAGERVIIAVRSLDFIHGMNIPALKMRHDLLPSQVTRIELPPLAPGVVDFLCDNFCGDGHETMHGRFIVSA